MPFAAAFARSRLALAQAEIARRGGGPTDLEAALAAATEIADDALRAQTLWTLVGTGRGLSAAPLQARIVAEAERASAAIKSELSRVWMFGEVALAHHGAGDLSTAWSAFRAGLDVAGGIDNPWARARAFGKLAATLAEFEEQGLATEAAPR
ncbi:MAG: hypothetical protein FJX53_13155 [Alphaproteobacteria bacterium]|nr:hypothetical protein [Alphaproteobacteria bacterium]